MKLNRKITFCKSKKYEGSMIYAIISTIKELCNEYNVQIKFIELNDSFINNSYIITKTDKVTFNKICISFCEKLNSYIEDIKF